MSLLGMCAAFLPAQATTEVAQPKDQAKEQPKVPMETRTFSVPHDFLNLYSLPSDDPFVTGKDRDLPHFRLGTARQVLEAQGIALLKHGTALFDPVNCKLTVTGGPADLDLVQSFVDSVASQAYKTLTLTVHVIEAPDQWLRPLGENTDEMDASQHLQRLFEASTTAETLVRVLYTSLVETTSGQRATLQTTADSDYTASLTTNAQGRTTAESKPRSLGFHMEVDPLIDADGFTVRGKFSARLTSLAEEPASVATPLELDIGRVETELSIGSGRTKVAGSWPVANGRSQAVFVTAHVITQQMVHSLTSTLTQLPKEAGSMMRHTFALPAEFLKRDVKTATGEWSELPPLRGIDLPKGSEVRVEEPNKMIVRTTAEMMTVVDASVQRLLGTYPKSLAFRFDVIRAPAALMRPLILDSASLSDHSLVFQKLRQSVSAGHATHEMLSYVETKGGRAKVTSHLDRHLLTELNWRKEQPPGFTTRHEAAGCDVELDATIDADGYQAAFSWTMERHFAPPKIWRELLAPPASDRSLAIPRNEFGKSRIQSSGRIMDGQTRLVALWRPVGEDGKIGEDVLEAVFITCHVVRQLPAANNEFAPWRTTEPQTQTTLPAGMRQRTFKVPRDFLMLSVAGTSQASLDPFGPGGAWVANNRHGDLLTHAGISAPEGSSGLYNASTSELKVVNTEANLSLLEAWMKNIWEAAPKVIQCQLHLFEVPTSAAAGIIENNLGKPDQADALNRLLALVKSGGAKALATLQVTGKDGQSAKVGHSKEASYVNAVAVSATGMSDIRHGVEPVGTDFEMRPTLAAGGSIVHLDMALTYHPAPPRRQIENMASAGTPPAEVALTDFHSERYSSSLTLLANTTRILAVWKPTGKPEFETQDLLHIAILEAKVLETQ
jgi:hypothetical protein